MSNIHRAIASKADACAAKLLRRGAKVRGLLPEEPKCTALHFAAAVCVIHMHF